MDCHVFLCNSKGDAKELALGLGAAFEKAFLKEKKGELLSEISIHRFLGVSRS